MGLVEPVLGWEADRAACSQPPLTGHRCGCHDILILTKAVLVPTLDMIAPKYFELVICSSFWHFMVISAQVLVVLLAMIFNFFLLT